jgi:hypothetical protein
VVPPAVRVPDAASGPLTGYDLQWLKRVPGVVVLAACEGGRHVVLAGDELRGLAATLLATRPCSPRDPARHATLLASGARQVVASVVPVPDAETAPLMAAAAGFVCLGADGGPV